MVICLYFIMHKFIIGNCNIYKYIHIYEVYLSYFYVIQLAYGRLIVLPRCLLIINPYPVWSAFATSIELWLDCTSMQSDQALYCWLKKFSRLKVITDWRGTWCLPTPLQLDIHHMVWLETPFTKIKVYHCKKAHIFTLW